MIFAQGNRDRENARQRQRNQRRISLMSIKSRRRSSAAPNSLMNILNSEANRIVQQRLSVKYIMIHSVIVTVSSVALIALQIVGLILNLKENYTASGIW